MGGCVGRGGPGATKTRMALHSMSEWAWALPTAASVHPSPSDIDDLSLVDCLRARQQKQLCVEIGDERATRFLLASVSMQARTCARLLTSQSGFSREWVYMLPSRSSSSDASPIVSLVRLRSLPLCPAAPSIRLARSCAPFLVVHCFVFFFRVCVYLCAANKHRDTRADPTTAPSHPCALRAGRFTISPHTIIIRIPLISR